MNTEPATVTQFPTPLERAAKAFEAAKAAEAAAQKARLAAEVDLLAALQASHEAPIEGTVSEVVAGLKVAARYAINRTVDQDRLREIAAQVPEAIGRRLFRWKAEIEMRELRFIESNEPQIYALVAQAITAKPAKPSVSVERIEG